MTIARNVSLSICYKLFKASRIVFSIGSCGEIYILDNNTIYLLIVDFIIIVVIYIHISQLQHLRPLIDEFVRDIVALESVLASALLFKFCARVFATMVNIS